ncbi:nucleotidyltransferase family protein [Rhodoflexus sp.]
MINIEEIKQKTRPIFHKYNIKKAGIFGSFAKGTANARSDIDLLIETQENISLLDFIQIKNELEDTLSMPVDLVLYDAVKARLQDDIFAEEIRIYGKEQK